MVIVRRARVADAAELAAVAAEAYARYVPRIGRAPAPMTADYAAAVRAGQAWVAAEDGQIVGLLILVRHADHLLLENVAVRPAAQGRGIGGRLLAKAEQHARRLNLPEIRLYTNEAMTENVTYYVRRGYAETHRAEHCGYRRVFFAKRLTGATRAT